MFIRNKIQNLPQQLGDTECNVKFIDMNLSLKSIMIIILCQIAVFSFLEKNRKEQFVLNTTNNLTKKKLLNVINKSDFASAIVY